MRLPEANHEVQTSSTNIPNSRTIRIWRSYRYSQGSNTHTCLGRGLRTYRDMLISQRLPELLQRPPGAEMRRDITMTDFTRSASSINSK